MQEPKISHLTPGKAIDSYCPLTFRARTLLPIPKKEEESLSDLLQQPMITLSISVLKHQLQGTTDTH